MTNNNSQRDSQGGGKHTVISTKTGTSGGREIKDSQGGGKSTPIKTKEK